MVLSAFSQPVKLFQAVVLTSTSIRLFCKFVIAFKTRYVHRRIPAKYDVSQSLDLDSPRSQDTYDIEKDLCPWYKILFLRRLYSQNHQGFRPSKLTRMPTGCVSRISWNSVVA